MQAPNGEEILEVASVDEWAAWLEEHSAEQAGVWLRLVKKSAGIPGITRPEALDVALAYGWIDSQSRSDSDTHSLQRYSPRRARSPWSRVNVERVAELTADGRMRPPGLAQVEAAKADGRWDAAYAAQRHVEVPPELAEALAGDPDAARAFENLGKSARYQLILPLLKIRTQAGRQARIARTLAALREGPDAR